jgi:hypothetical protein
MEPETNNEQIIIQKPKGGRVGPVIGSVIVIILIILGGAYYLKTFKTNIEGKKNVAPENSLSDVEQEIENINTDDIEADLNQIDVEIEEALN